MLQKLFLWGLCSLRVRACVLGFLVLAVIAATMNPNVSEILNSKFGQPMAQVSSSAFVNDSG